MMVVKRQILLVRMLPAVTTVLVSSVAPTKLFVFATMVTTATALIAFPLQTHVQGLPVAITAPVWSAPLMKPFVSATMVTTVTTLIAFPLQIHAQRLPVVITVLA
jgi:hypothetical protein